MGVGCLTPRHILIMPGIDKLRKLDVEEMPLDVQNAIIEMNNMGTPIVQIVNKLKDDYGVETNDVSLKRFTTKYIEPKVTERTRGTLDRSFDRAIANMNNMHGLNEEAIRRLQGSDVDDKWFMNVRTVGLNTLDCFKALYLIQGQKISEEKTSELGDQMEKINQMIKRARKDKVVEDPIIP